MILLRRKCREKKPGLCDWLITNIKDFMVVEWQTEIQGVFMQILRGWCWIGPQISAGITEMEAAKCREFRQPRSRLRGPRPSRQVLCEGKGRDQQGDTQNWGGG
uniref:Uncharacterized protein n=1 Tax=Prolemur simus TaxID=1328070 RepID=A0A8C9ARD3_PROSS